MTRSVRLGWEVRVDQVTVAVDVAIVGVGLVLVGVFGLVGAVGDVVVVVVGVLLCLFDGLRLLGWRTLVWPRTFTVGPGGVADDGKKGHGFRLAWADVAALGVYGDPSGDRSRGLLLVVYPSAGADPSAFGPGLAHVPGDAGDTADAGDARVTGDTGGPLVARLPRRAGVVAVLCAGAPEGWRRAERAPEGWRRTERAPQSWGRTERAPEGWGRAERAPWDVLLTAPGVGAEIVPPRVEPVVTVDVGRRLARQGVVGAVLAAFFGVSAMVAAFGGGPAPAGQRIAVAAVGAPFVLVAVALVLGGPVMVRRRRILLDGHTFTWEDPGEDSFTAAWADLAAVFVEMHVVHNVNTGDRYGVRVVLEPKGADFATRHPTMARFAAGDRYVVPLGDQPHAARAIAAAVERLAPGVWRGVRTDRRHIGLT